MLQKRDGVFLSSLIASLRGVIHGFSSRGLGDMRQETINRKRFVKGLGFNQMPLLAWQTHGNMVPGDGLVSMTHPVAVVTADCAPLLLVDPEAHVCAAVHAGWKGTLGSIVKNAVTAMTGEGARIERIYAAIGPHIGGCCYNVPEDRADAFIAQFGEDEKMAFLMDGQWHLDLGWTIYQQLTEAGVHPDHIDAPPTCTSCQNQEFFSYRKDRKETYGEMMAVIGFI